MTGAVVIPFAPNAAAIRRQRQAKRDQALIDAMEAMLDEQPAMGLEELVRRATKQVEERAQ